MMKLSVQHQGRELMHVIELLTRCLLLPNCSVQVRAGWDRDMLTARTDLETLYTAGLERNFLSIMPGLRAPGVQPTPPHTRRLNRRH